MRNTRFEKLVKPWFAGGTVTLASVQTPYHYLANHHERFENGTVNYLDLPAVSIGLDYITSIGLERISERVAGLASYLTAELKKIRHASGAPVVKVFGPSDRKNTGGTMIMNFFDEKGLPFPLHAIERLANDRLISIRTGCFCNPGVDEVNHGLAAHELLRYFFEQKPRRLP